MTPSRRARWVLRKLEEAMDTRAARDRGPWVSTLELQRAAGYGFKVGVHELACKKKPEDGLGFVIARRPLEETEGGRPVHGYMIAGYPLWWGKGGWDACPQSGGEETETDDPASGGIAAGSQLGLPGMQARAALAGGLG